MKVRAPRSNGITGSVLEASATAFLQRLCVQRHRRCTTAIADAGPRRRDAPGTLASAGDRPGACSNLRMPFCSHDSAPCSAGLLVSLATSPFLQVRAAKDHTQRRRVDLDEHSVSRIDRPLKAAFLPTLGLGITCVFFDRVLESVHRTTALCRRRCYCHAERCLGKTSSGCFAANQEGFFPESFRSRVSSSRSAPARYSKRRIITGCSQLRTFGEPTSGDLPSHDLRPTFRLSRLAPRSRPADRRRSRCARCGMY